jgi:hypothetical protein
MSDAWKCWKSEVERPGDGFLAGRIRRAALAAHQQKVGALTMVGRQWSSRAACRDVDPEAFFPTAQNGAARDREVQRAKAVCAACPVLAQCREWAVETLAYGIAGGLDEDERAELRRGSGRPKVAPQVELPVGAGRWTRQRSEVIAAGRRALAAGHPRTRVARDFGVSRRTVDRWAADKQGGAR